MKTRRTVAWILTPALVFGLGAFAAADPEYTYYTEGYLKLVERATYAKLSVLDQEELAALGSGRVRLSVEMLRWKKMSSFSADGAIRVEMRIKEALHGVAGVFPMLDPADPDLQARVVEVLGRVLERVSGETYGRVILKTPLRSADRLPLPTPQLEVGTWVRVVDTDGAKVRVRLQDGREGYVPEDDLLQVRLVKKQGQVHTHPKHPDRLMLQDERILPRWEDNPARNPETDPAFTALRGRLNADGVTPQLEMVLLGYHLQRANWYYVLGFPGAGGAQGGQGFVHTLGALGE